MSFWGETRKRKRTRTAAALPASCLFSDAVSLFPEQLLRRFRKAGFLRSTPEYGRIEAKDLREGSADHGSV